MSENRAFKFKLFYAKFLKIDKYMCQKRLTVDPKSIQWKELVSKFNNSSVEPLERAWAKLDLTEKDEFSKIMGWA